MAELGLRLSHQEFVEWQLVFAHEQLHPSAEVRRHAELLAATHLGPATRRDKQPWQASQFYSAPWLKAIHVDFDAVSIPRPEGRKSVPRKQILDHVKQMNSRIRK